jgi:hypothetical protein
MTILTMNELSYSIIFLKLIEAAANAKLSLEKLDNCIKT